MRSHLLLAAGAGLLCIAPAAAADELPKRKAGLWEIKMVVNGRGVPLRNVQQCTDAETDTLMATSLHGVMGNACDKPKISNSDGTITVEAACKAGAGSKTTRAVIAGDFDSAYTITVTSLPASGESSGSGESAAQPPMTLEAKWIGPCREGQRPGDIIMPGGIKLNVRSLTIGAGALPRP
jgi:hypothetical protein